MKTRQNLEHPCFSIEAAHAFARLHLPVAPACNIKCAYCNRKFDCVNESRPGVTSSVLSPEEAAARFKEMKRRFPNLRVVGIAGPGDALANPEQTFRTFRLVREADTAIDFCLSTNGVSLPGHLDEIRRIGIRFLTITINSRRLEVARTLYHWAQDGDVRLEGTRAAEFILARQEEALDALEGTGIHVKVNTICIPGVNDHEIEAIVRFAKEKGAGMVNLMPFIPTPGTYFENFAMVSRETLRKIRERMAEILPMMRHCRQCRADAVGNVLNERPVFVEGDQVRELPFCAGREAADVNRGEAFRFAVASGNGYLVDLHFGHADELLIYDATPSAVRFIERRQVRKYCGGKERCEDPEERVANLAGKLADCHALLAIRIGDAPRRALEAAGILVVMTCNRIEDAIRENRALLEGRRAVHA